MATKLIIKESQYKALKSRLDELAFTQHQMMVERMVADLDMNYEPMLGVVRDAGEYFDEPMVKIKIDDTEITIKQLFKYFKDKYKVGDAFTKQVITDWLFGRIEDNKLSKNVGIN